MPEPQDPHRSKPESRCAGPWGTFNWSYDETGNRWFESLTQGATTYGYWYAYPSDRNKFFQVTTETDLVHWFSYDGAGNVTEDWHGPITPYYYHYDNRGRIDQLTINSTVTATYIYDAEEHLVARTTLNMTPAGTTHYVYDLAGHLVMEANDSGTILREYVWIDDQPLAVMADLETSTPHLYYVHPDHLNRPIKMTDDGQAVVWDAIYQPFGAVYSISGSASLNLGFPGQYFLLESGLYHNWHRDYDPAIGRYFQADPFGFIDGPSLYAYAKSSPLVYTDPRGEFLPPVIVAIGIIAAYVMTPTIANAPGPGDKTFPVDDIAPFKNAAIAAACLAPHWWWSRRSGGGGVRLWKDGPGVDWHRFRLKKGGPMVNRPHIEPSGQWSKGHHWPWN